MRGLPISRNADRLLELLKNAGIGMNQRGEMVIKGENLPGTNFEDIIHYLVRNRSTVLAPKGFDEITPYIRDLNVPKSLVTNLKARREIYKQRGRGSRRMV